MLSFGNRMRRQDQRVEPSAPPLDMVPPDPANDQDWGPPPRYEEAIADDLPANSQAATNISLLPAGPGSTTSQQPDHNYSRPSSRNQLTETGPATSLLRNRQRLAGSLNSISGSGAGNQHLSSRGDASARFRSASPGDILSQDDNQLSEQASLEADSTGTDSASAKKKKSSSSKIKKGLESIAFFIIQILD